MFSSFAGPAYMFSAVILTIAFALGYTVCRTPFASIKQIMKKFGVRILKFWGFLLILAIIVHFFSK